MQDGCGEAADLAEDGVDVERVEVTGETVEGCLLLGGLLLDGGVWCALRWLMGLCGSAAVAALLLAAEVARAADEDCAFVVEDLLTGVCVLGGRSVDHEASGALVDDLDELGDGDELGLGGDGELVDLEELLAVEKHAWVKVGDDLVKAEG